MQKITSCPLCGAESAKNAGRWSDPKWCEQYVNEFVAEVHRQLAITHDHPLSPTGEKVRPKNSPPTPTPL